MKLAGPGRVTLESLFNEEDGCFIDFNTSADFDPCELIRSADVIIGVDVDTGKEYPVYGNGKVLEHIADSGAPATAAILRVEIDVDGDYSESIDLDRLVTLVQMATGLIELDDDEE